MRVHAGAGAVGILWSVLEEVANDLNGSNTVLLDCIMDGVSPATREIARREFLLSLRTDPATLCSAAVSGLWPCYSDAAKSYFDEMLYNSNGEGGLDMEVTALICCPSLIDTHDCDITDKRDIVPGREEVVKGIFRVMNQWMIRLATSEQMPADYIFTELYRRGLFAFMHNTSRFVNRRTVRLSQFKTLDSTVDEEVVIKLYQTTRSVECDSAFVRECDDFKEIKAALREQVHGSGMPRQFEGADERAKALGVLPARLHARLA